jgi:glucan phosphoethanolaminetransferase (alkaline phosphatase superfamily)
MIYLLLEAKPNEISEFTQSLWLWKVLTILVPSLMFYLSFHLIPKNYKLSGTIRKYYTISLLSLYLFTFSVKTIQRKTLSKAFKVASYEFLQDTPAHTIRRTYKAIKAHKTNLLKEQKNSLNIEKYNIERNSNRPLTMVLIIGESSRYKNWSTNGYCRPTSVFLDSIDGLISLSNIISPSFSTAASIPALLSVNESLNNSGSVLTIIDLFNEANFQTYWLGNQHIEGTVVGSIAKSSTIRLSTPNSKKANLDETLLPLLENALSDMSDNKFIILHTQGSHYPYQNRYSNDFEVFTPALQRNRHLPYTEKIKQQVVNSYDNSIYYTSYIIAEVIQMLEGQNTSSVVIYLSDHGENLFDYPNIGFGRGYGKVTEKLFHIPCFIWFSNRYKKNNMIRWENLISNKDLKTITLEISYTLAELADINWIHNDSTRSLSNTNYQAQQRFLTFGDTKKKYDDLIKER